MKKRIIPLILAVVLCAMQIPAFAAYEVDCSSSGAPFTMVIRDQTDGAIAYEEFQEPMPIFKITPYNDYTIRDEWSGATMFGENAVFTVTNNSVDVIKITYREYQKAEQPVYYGSYVDSYYGASYGLFNDASLGTDEFYPLIQVGEYYSRDDMWMEFTNKTDSAFECHSLLVGGDSCCYAIKKGETVTFQLPIQDQSLCWMSMEYYDLNGNYSSYDGYYSWWYRLMRNDAYASAEKADQPSDWAKAEISAAVEAGLVPENLQKNYTAPVSRANVAQMFVNLIEKSCGTSMDALLAEKGVEINPDAFSDTADKAVLACNALGIINGVGNGQFDPNSTFTRGQIAAILNRIAGVVGIETSGYTHSFTDVDGHWCSAELGWPAHVGIINGVGDNKFDPDGELTTEQAIAIVYRAMDIIGKA